MPYYLVSKENKVKSEGCRDEVVVAREYCVASNMKRQKVESIDDDVVMHLWKQAERKGWRCEWSEGDQAKGQDWDHIKAGRVG